MRKPSGQTTGRGARPWLRILLTGLLLWLATVAVTFLTGNPNLIPTLVLLGSFLVPVTFVAWAFERRGPAYQRPVGRVADASHGQTVARDGVNPHRPGRMTDRVVARPVGIAHGGRPVLTPARRILGSDHDDDQQCAAGGAPAGRSRLPVRS